jgi:hypothetical protein
MFNKFLSLFCKHDWSDWKYMTFGLGHYDQETWFQRSCAKCGKVQMTYEDGTIKTTSPYDKGTQ